MTDEALHECLEGLMSICVTHWHVRRNVDVDMQPFVDRLVVNMLALRISLLSLLGEPGAKAYRDVCIRTYVIALETLLETYAQTMYEQTQVHE